MILTLTPNPSLDLLFSAERLVWDDANRIDAPRRRPGGQGINVVRAARELGGEAMAVAPFGGRVGAELKDRLEAEGTPIVAIRIDGETRLFVGARETATGHSLLLNPRGPTLTGTEVEALLEAVRGAIDLHSPAWVCACGSIPPGGPPDLYARVGRLARERGARFVPDCDGEPLRLAAESGCDLLVPNLHEAARLLGRELRGADAAAVAAPDLLRFGARAAAITLGHEGAVLASPVGCWRATPPRVDAGSAVGAGDAFLAALLLALEDDAAPPDALRAAVAAGTAVLSSAGDALLRRERADALAPDVRVVRTG